MKSEVMTISKVMIMEKHKKNIESVIENTFNVIQNVYENQQENQQGKGDYKGSSGSRILFPKKSNGETRISEQELRFIFVEQLNKKIGDGTDWDVYYSVETPTIDKYRFSGVNDPLKGDGLNDLNGQSANFDLVIHDNEFKRIALIEFKANNASEHEHLKDLKKLTNPKEYDNNIPTYFIEILKGADRGTIKSLHDKMERKEQVNFRCWALERKGDHDITSNIIEYPNK